MSNTIYYIQRYLIFVFWIAVLTSCGTQGVRFSSKYPMQLDPAARLITNNLLKEVEKEKGITAGVLGKTKVALDPFIDASTGEVVGVSREIEQFIIEEGTKKFPTMELTRVTPSSLRQSDYIINGTIELTDYPIAGVKNAEKLYKLSSSIVNLKSGEIIANTENWLSEKNLDYTPSQFAKDSPAYLKDKRAESQIATSQSVAGQSAEKEYYDTLDTHSLLIEAETIYEQEKYTNALKLFKKASLRDDGQIMKTYAGLYETFYKLNDTKAAQEAFIKLLEVSVKENKKLNVKLLFSVNSTQFIPNEDLRKQYELWLKQIGQFFTTNNYCFEVVGHGSHSGGPAYNERLSLKRAERVHQLILNKFSGLKKKSRAVGRGFLENVVGSGTDDARDAIDRRVEFTVIDCATL